MQPSLVGVSERAHPVAQAFEWRPRLVGENADTSHPLALLSARRERPCSRAADQRDERAALHSITSSARSRSDSGIFSLSALAVVRLIIRSNLVGCSTGRSAAFAPRRILSTRPAARR